MDSHTIRPHQEKGRASWIIPSLMVLAFALIAFNQYSLMALTTTVISGGQGEIPTGVAVAQASDIIPIGTPPVYGEELGLRYDDVTPANPQQADQAIRVMGDLDRALQLEGADLERYVRIVSQISCEYCCGAKSIIFDENDVVQMDQQIKAALESGKITAEDATKYQRQAGDAACGCAHSYAMRGVAKYMILKHGAEVTDDEILTELAKWKVLFFPAQMTAKAEIMKGKGIEFSYINLGSNKYRGIEQGTAGGGMVGGC